MAVTREGMVKPTLCILVLLAFAFLLAGCGGSKRLTDLETKTAANATALAELKGKVDGFPALVAANGSQITDLKKVVDSYSPLISGNGSRITDLERQIATYPSMIASNASQIAALEKRVEGYPSLIDQNSKEIASLRRDLDSYSNQFSSAAQQLAEVKKQVDGQSSTILGNLTLIANNSTQLSQLQRQVDGFSAAVDAQNAKVAELAAQLADVVTQIEASVARMAKLEERVGAYAAQADADHAALAALEARVETDSDRIGADASLVAALGGAVQSHSQTIAELETKVAEIGARVGGLSSLLKVGYLNPDLAFAALTETAGDLLQTVAAKEAELVTLGEEFDAGAITGQDYAQTSSRLRVELLVVRVDVDLALIDAWAVRPDFAQAQADLSTLKGDGQKLVAELASLWDGVRKGGLDQNQFVSQYGALEARSSALDGSLREIGQARVLAAAEKVARAKGYDLILRSEDVLVNGNADKMPDITGLVKDELLALPK